ncbi:MAG: heat-inducible transcriptional repressor HrcA [Candidatus Kapaibacteriota bacterium]
MEHVAERLLNDREQTILRAIVHTFVRQASPVGSRALSKQLQRELHLSAATIRNVMADLEDMGYIAHPHTSAGRVPTDRGYRLYVDSLMERELLTAADTQQVDVLAQRPKEQLFREASRILGSLSYHLAVIQIPKVRDVLVRRVELVPLSSERILVVLALQSDILRTITIESAGAIPDAQLHELASFINERVSGRPLSHIDQALSGGSDAIRDAGPAFIRLFVERLQELDQPSSGDLIHISGTPQLLRHPEFEHPEKVRSVIELIDNEEVIVHVLDQVADNSSVAVRIGQELGHERLQDYSVVSTTYCVGEARGSVSLIGPKRMQYSRMMSLVQLVSDTLHTSLHQNASSS